MNEEFTKEELEVLGEQAPEEDPETSTKEESDTGESQESEEETEEIPESEKEEETETETEQEEEEDKKDPVPYDRFSKVYGEKKELERKLELFRKDPEEYFKQYPDEKPEEEQQEEKTEILTFGEAGSLVVHGGEYDGLTLREVFEKDPFAAQDIYMQYKEQLITKQRDEKEIQEKLKAESNKEINGFAHERARELFDKPEDFDIADLSEKEAKQINQELQETIDWMTRTGRGGGKIKDAYILKNLDKILENATKKGTSGLLNHLKKPSSQSISSKKTSTGAGMDSYIDMDASQLIDIIEDMDDQEYLNFRKNAPKSLRDKLPGLDWG